MKDKATTAAPIDWRELVHSICTDIDWTAVAGIVLKSKPLGKLVGDAVVLLGGAVMASRPTATEEDTAPKIDPAVRAAATLLDVEADATEAQIRAALRARLAASRLHPDHGGGGEEARQLIAARDLLLQHARARHPNP